MMSKYNFDRRNVDLRLIVVKVMIVMGNIDYRRIVLLIIIYRTIFINKFDIKIIL